MYNYFTVDLRVRPDATAAVHGLLMIMCSLEFRALEDEGADYVVKMAEQATGDSKTLQHPFFCLSRWNDIFYNWTHDSEHWGWNDQGPVCQYADYHLQVRSSFTHTYQFERFVDWVEPWLDTSYDNKVYYWYEESYQRLSDGGRPVYLLGAHPVKPPRSEDEVLGRWGYN
jgi:hypothetical protein